MFRPQPAFATPQPNLRTFSNLKSTRLFANPSLALDVAMIELLAALSAAAAASMRIAVPLFVMGILQSSDFSFHIPLFTRIPPLFVLTILISGSLFELVGSKKRLSQRFLQLIQLVFSPIVGGILAFGVTYDTTLPSWLFALIGAVFTFVLQLVQTGWFYQHQGFPLWLIFLQDMLCISLVVLAIQAPQIGGLIALVMLWVATRIMKDLHR